MKIRAASLLLAALLCAHADTLFLKDGNHVTGRWWSADATQVHFLIDNRLQHYQRADVKGVAFGNATELPPVGPVYKPAQPTPETREVNLPPKPAAATAPARPLSEPEQPGVVYFRNGSGELIPLERTQAVERKKGSVQYWEMQPARSPVRLQAASEMQFVVKLDSGTGPEAYGLYPMESAANARRTKAQAGRKAAPATLEFETAKAGESVYTFTVKGMAPGEYSFSPSGSNDAYCFGVDPAAK